MDSKSQNLKPKEAPSSGPQIPSHLLEYSPRRPVQFVQFSSIQLLSCVQLFMTPWTAAHQASLFITNSPSVLKLVSIKSVMPSTISSSVIPFSCLQYFPASGSFPVSQFFPSGGQSIGVSALASVLPMNIWG